MVGAIVVERKYFTCPSRESNPGHWINRQTLYHVAVKAGFYRKAVEVYHIPIPCDINIHLQLSSETEGPSSTTIHCEYKKARL